MTTELDASLGAAAESVYGTAVTVTKFVEFTAESLDWDPTFVQGQGLRVGSRFPRGGRRGLGKQQCNGDITVEVASKGLGWLLNAALGAVTTTQRATTGVYQQNHTPSTTDPLNSYTIQKGVPPIGGGATLPHTFAGMVCDQIEINCPNADIATVKTSWTGKSVATATAYAAPAYPTPVELFTFADGAIVIGGSPTAPTTTALATGGTSVANVRDFDLTIANNLDDGGFNFGAAGTRARKPSLGMGAITGTMTVEFDSAVMRDAFLNQTDLAVYFTLLGTTTIGSGSDHPALQIYIPSLRLEGELPKVSSGGNVVTQSVAFTALDNLSAAPVTVVYASTDTAP